MQNVQGKFMGSGVTTATAKFRPERKGAGVLDLYLKINETQLKSMNDLLRAYGKFDVTAGRLFRLSLNYTSKTILYPAT